MKNLYFSGALDPKKSCHIMHALLERQHLRSVTNDGLQVIFQNPKLWDLKYEILLCKTLLSVFALL